MHILLIIAIASMVIVTLAFTALVILGMVLAVEKQNKYRQMVGKSLAEIIAERNF